MVRFCYRFSLEIVFMIIDEAAAVAVDILLDDEQCPENVVWALEIVELPTTFSSYVPINSSRSGSQRPHRWRVEALEGLRRSGTSSGRHLGCNVSLSRSGTGPVLHTSTSRCDSGLIPISQFHSSPPRFWIR